MRRARRLGRHARRRGAEAGVPEAGRRLEDPDGGRARGAPKGIPHRERRRREGGYQQAEHGGGEFLFYFEFFLFTYGQFE